MRIRRDAGGDRRQGAAARLRSECTLDSVGDLCAGLGAAVDDDCELVAADAEQLFAHAKDTRGRAGDLREHGVPGRMAAGVVEALEVVEIEEDDRQLLLDGGRLPERRLQPLVESAAVREAGQGVPPRLRVRQREPALGGECGRRQLGDVGNELLVRHELGVGRHRHQQRAEHGPVGDERDGERIRAVQAELGELAQVVAVRVHRAEGRVRP